MNDTPFDASLGHYPVDGARDIQGFSVLPSFNCRAHTNQAGMVTKMITSDSRVYPFLGWSLTILISYVTDFLGDFRGC